MYILCLSGLSYSLFSCLSSKNSSSIDSVLSSIFAHYCILCTLLWWILYNCNNFVPPLAFPSTTFGIRAQVHLLQIVFFLLQHLLSSVLAWEAKYICFWADSTKLQELYLSVWRLKVNILWELWAAFLYRSTLQLLSFMTRICFNLRELIWSNPQGVTVV